MRTFNRISATVLCMALSVTAMHAQVRDVRPERESDGKMLSIEDVTVNRNVYPTSGRFYWDTEGNVTETPAWRGGREWKLPASDTEGIAYGTTVSRNEFGINGGVFPSPDGTRLAVYRKDERAVTMFPLLDIKSRTGSLENIRYPMNGMPSEHITLCVCDTLGTVLGELKVDDFSDERYLTCVSWNPSGTQIYVQVLDRSQHHMRLNRYDVASGECIGTVLTEDNDAWVEPYEELHFLNDDLFIYSIDNRDGYKNLYLCSNDGGVRRITAVDADVQFVASAPARDGAWIYYTSAEVSPVENHLFRIRLSRMKDLARTRIGKAERLTPERGWHRVSMSPDRSRFIDWWTAFDDAGGANLRNADGTLVKELHRSADPLSGYAQCEMELGTVKSADGRFDNWYRFYKPLGWSPDKKYPLVVYVYGGPHSQMVKDSWLGGIRMWEMLMAQRGYVVYVQDNRGTSNRGSEFEKAINRACGQAEMADQMAGLNALLERCPWIDRDRIGVHGWSYGGFMTISLFTNYPDTFKVAVAGGPVIDWKWYEVMYGERYMDTEETNPEGFARTSLMNMTDGVHGRLLICQGAIDNTVVWEHSLSFTQKCIEKGKRLDYFPYPISEHNMTGKARVHLYDKITDYFDSWL